MISSNVSINALSRIGNAVICNTGCIIEHECEVDDFVHVGPGTVLCGNVSIGKGTFVGANAVIRQGVHIGKNCMIGAGAVVIRDVFDNTDFMLKVTQGYGIPRQTKKTDEITKVQPVPAPKKPKILFIGKAMISIPNMPANL